MTETFIALLLGHVLGDYVLQSTRMGAQKRRVTVLLLHVAIVGLASLAALGGAPLMVLAVVLAHLAIDAVKTYLAPETLVTYLLDQAAHVAVIAGAAYLVPGAFAAGLWGGAPAVVM